MIEPLLEKKKLLYYLFHFFRIIQLGKKKESEIRYKRFAGFTIYKLNVSIQYTDYIRGCTKTWCYPPAPAGEE